MKRIIVTTLAICILVAGISILKINGDAKEINEIRKTASVPYYNLEDLTNKSQLIVRSVAENISDPHWNNTENKKPGKITGSDVIYQNITLQVIETLKGNVPEDNTVKVRTLGGVTDDFIFRVNPQPTITVCEEYIVFLINDNTIYNKEKAKNHFIILGVNQGIYKVNGDEISNPHEKLKVVEFKQNVKQYLLNPKTYPNVKSEE